jgi:hypothetical protein
MNDERPFPQSTSVAVVDPADESVVTDAADLVDKYVSLWNEQDAETRRTLIRSLWAPDGAHLLEPPADMRQAARAIGFDAPPLEARGYTAIESRVAQAFAEFVAPGEYAFRSIGNAARLRNLVKFNWEMVSTTSGVVAAVGLDVFTLDGDGRIAVDHQFIER